MLYCLEQPAQGKTRQHWEAARPCTLTVGLVEDEYTGFCGVMLRVCCSPSFWLAEEMVSSLSYISSLALAALTSFRACNLSHLFEHQVLSFSSLL